MSDADLIYNACLRAERRIEERIRELGGSPTVALNLHVCLTAIQTLREEIGSGLAVRERGQGAARAVVSQQEG